MVILLGRQGEVADGSASAAPRPQRELELIRPDDPVTRVGPSAPLHPTAPSSPTVVSPSTVESPPAVLPTTAGSPSPTMGEALPTHESPPVADAAGPVHGPAARPPVSAHKREVARVVPKPKPPRPVASEAEVAKPAPVPNAPKVVGAKPPFTAEQFDDAANTGGAPAAPEAAKGKKAPIVPGFDN
jgi:hypothetical protein